MKILYGTTNKAKLAAMKNALKEFDIELIGLSDMEGKLPQINESGATPLENAEIKARAYYKAFNLPVFSCDSGLYFDELQECEQPGLYIRRVGGKELTDDEMVSHYSALAHKYGGKITGRYRNAIYFVLDEDNHYYSMDMSIATEPFILTDKPHEKRVDGFPLDSLSVDIKTGKYYYDLQVKDVSTSVDGGVRKFFTEILNKNNYNLMEDITMEMEKEFITLEYEDGVELECEIMGVFDVDGKEYIALIPQDDSDEIFLYGYKEMENDEFELIDIEDDEEFARVSAEFDRLMEEEE